MFDYDRCLASLGPEMMDRLLTVLEQVADLPQVERDRVLDTALDLLDPLDAPRPHADPVKVAEGRAMLLEARQC